MPLLAHIKTHYPRVFSVLKNLRSFLSDLMEKVTVGKSQDDSSTASGVDPLPPFDPSKPAVPVSYPLKSLEELESRAYFKSFHFPFNEAAVKLASDGAGMPRRPRLLVCHDLAGGYTDDRFVQGGSNSDAYAIWHWYLIDVFVYFSHSLVTLPPPGWINTAHRHGVKILGTFIMEWDDGKALADRLLLTKDSVHMYADRLTELAVALGFDGWLLNMEVSLHPEQIPNLKEFVSYLSQTMHASLSESLVLWYDSVTVDGDLTWQNQLNDKNKPFFDLCDGIFVNYSWKEDSTKLSAKVAGDRNFDIYMGIDVFGRGTYGGGQWTTNVALDVINKDGLSAAIFAPGWVYETKQPPNFQTAQNRWWGLVEKSWGVVQIYPKELPFYTNFDQGHGFHIYSNGELVSGNPWNNISSQSFQHSSLQPLVEDSRGSTTQLIQVFVDFSTTSYNGGGNITFSGTLDNSFEFTTRLFLCDLLVGSSPIHITYSVKASESSQLGLALEFFSSTLEKKSVLLAAPGNALFTMNQFSSRFTSVIMPRRVMKLEKQPGWVIQENSIDMAAGHTLKEIRAVCYSSNPKRSDAVASVETLSAEPSEYDAVLGDIKITTGEYNSTFPSADSWLVDGQFISWTSSSQGSNILSLKLIWQLKVDNANLFPKYNIYIDKVTDALSDDRTQTPDVAKNYLGVAFVKCFYVSELEVHPDTSSLKFIIQVYGLDGDCQKLEDSPFFILEAKSS